MVNSPPLRGFIGTVHERAVFRRRTQTLAERIEPLLPHNARVLDVGTGDGTIASLWQLDRPDLNIEGIDVLVRERTNIPVRKFDGRTIPFEDKTWDVVTFVDVLHHTHEVEYLLSEAARVARSRVIIKDHFAESAIDHVTLRLMDWVGNAPHGVVLPYNYLSRAAWSRLLEQAKLDVASMDEHVPLYPFPFSLVFGRGLHFIAELRPPLAPR